MKGGRNMNTLEMYRKLSKEDKNNLTKYCIYNSIFDVARNKEIDIDDNVVEEIQDLAYNSYLKDEFYKFSSSEIAFFLTKCYVNDKDFIQKANEISYHDILQAINDDDYDFYKDIELER